MSAMIDRQLLNHKMRKRKHKEAYAFLNVSILLDEKFMNDLEINSYKGKSGVYVISVLDQYFKIGSSGDIYKRLLSIERSLPFEIKVEKCFESDCYKTLENYFHKMFEDKKIKTEWFSLDLYNDIYKMEETFNELNNKI